MVSSVMRIGEALAVRWEDAVFKRLNDRLGPKHDGAFIIADDLYTILCLDSEKDETGWIGFHESYLR
jgi:hypothetical protein